MFYKVLFVVYSFCLHQCMSKPEVYDVLILGCGASGIGTAISLHEQGIDNFLILEAKDYIGGRVKSQQFAGKSVPMGAGWIHGADESNIMWRLAKKYKMKVHKDNYDYDDIVFRNGTNGVWYPQWLVNKIHHKLEKDINKMDELLEGRRDKGRSDLNVKSGLRWAKWIPTTPLEQAIEYYKFDFENGIEPGALSGMSYGVTGEGGDDYIITDSRGYEHILKEEVKPYQQKIRLNHEIMRITAIHNNTLYEVMTTKWKKYYTKKVVVTFSAGVLTYGNVKFIPSLPEWKMEALNMVPMCHYCKIYLRFPNAFWDDSYYIMLTAKTRGEYVHWQNFKVPTLFPNENILMLTLTGDTCVQNQKKTDSEVIEEITKVLKSVYPNATAPSEVLRNNWSNDRHFRGAYSYQVSGISEADYEALEHSVEKNIWFTGEYTGRSEEYGFTHGAYNLGYKMAKKLASCLKDENLCPVTQPPSYGGQKKCTT